MLKSVKFRIPKSVSLGVRSPGMPRNAKRRARITKSAAPAAESPNLGACLRRLRYERRLSIADVALVTGIAKSTLSRVENDRLSLTYTKLLQLCRGLQIDLAELFSHDQAKDASRPSGRRSITSPGGGKRVQVGKLEYQYLCTDLAGKKMTPMLGRIAARSLDEANGLWSHEGEEFTLVLRGRMLFHTEFYEPLVVEQGGSVYFDSTMRHAYVSIGEEPLEIVCICSTPDLMLKIGKVTDQGVVDERFAESAVRRARARRTRAIGGS